MTDLERARAILKPWYDAPIDWSGESEQLEQIVAAALAAVREEERERCASLCDEYAQAMHNIAETIKNEWITPDMDADDRQANMKDRLEHLDRIPVYEGMARAIRALAVPATT